MLTFRVNWIDVVIDWLYLLFVQVKNSKNKQAAVRPPTRTRADHQVILPSMSVVCLTYELLLILVCSGYCLYQP